MLLQDVEMYLDQGEKDFQDLFLQQCANVRLICHKLHTALMNEREQMLHHLV